MRKFILTIAAAAALLAPGVLANRADAMTIGTPAGLRGAIEDVAVTDQVYWRRYHRWRCWGCYRGYVWWGPRIWWGPRYHRYHRWHRWRHW